MSSQPSSKSRRFTERASYHQLHPGESREPDPDTSYDINAAMPPTPPTPEPPDTKRTKRQRPHIFKSKPFSQMEIQGGERPARPSGSKPKPLHVLEITDLYPEGDDDDDPNISTAPTFHDSAPQDAATRKPSRRKPPTPPPSPLNRPPLSTQAPTFFESHSSSPSSPFTAYPHVLPLHTSLHPSERHLLRPQRFLSFLAEYTTSFVNYVLDINVSHKARYGVGRSRARRDTYYHGERERDRGTGREGKGAHVREGR